MKCNYCEAEAVVNYQKTWKKFKISKAEIYKEDKSFDAMDIKEPVDEDNIHLCRKHENPWLGEEI